MVSVTLRPFSVAAVTGRAELQAPEFVEMQYRAASVASVAFGTLLKSTVTVVASVGTAESTLKVDWLIPRKIAVFVASASVFGVLAVQPGEQGGIASE